MRRILTGLISLTLPAIFLISCNNKQMATQNIDQPPVTLVIHGGAGTILRGNMTAEREAEYRQKMEEALNAGYAILEQGGSSLDAVEAVIALLEDSPLFNAGKGSVFNNKGKIEMDASIMDGKTLNAGAVAGVSNVKNPIKLARLVMDKSPHVMMVGDGAVDFGNLWDIQMESDEYFKTTHRWQQLQDAQKTDTIQLDHAAPGNGSKGKGYSPKKDDQKYGTVGAVALDKKGNIAAATSTGGTTNKKYGRIGDSPIIGAGTYAENGVCGISSTGTGEYFIRLMVAYDIAALMKYRNLSIDEAARIVIHEKLKNLGGDGGVVGLDSKGNVIMEFNTEGMYRGLIREKGNPQVFIYKP